MDILNLLELEAAAKKVMSPMAFDYYAGGANDELTVLENREAFKRLALHYRVLTGVGARNLETKLFGQSISMPVIVAPTAFHRLAHTDGELATAKATQAAKTIMTVSTTSSTSLEDIRTSSPDLTMWFQMYLFKDTQISLEVLRRAETVGVKALVLTVDTPMLGRRERDIRQSFHLPDGIEMANFKMNLPKSVGSSLGTHVQEHFKMNLSYADLAWLRNQTNLPIIVKGICHPDDAVKSLEYGANSIWVSNHGGRQLDTSPATISVLPRVADAIRGQVPIILDGGVRRGTDIVKALSLGANAVALGRPILWSLAINGQAGIGHTLELLRNEIDTALGLCGYADLNIPRELVQPK